MDFISIRINGQTYTAPSPIEIINANAQDIQDYLNGLGLGVFVVSINEPEYAISSIQNPNTLEYYTTSAGDIAFSQSNCLDLDTDPDIACDYEIRTTADPSDVILEFVVGTQSYQPVSGILATDQAAVNAWLVSAGLGFITYQNENELYVIATMSFQNLSYIKVLRNGTTEVYIPFVQTNCRVPVVGCMDPLADNYNAAAEISDSSCVYGTLRYGCTDPTALNYNPNAQINDDSCIYEISQPIEKLKCCVGDIAASIAIAENNGQKVKCCQYKRLAYLTDLIFILERYHPDSENIQIVTIPGTPGTATFGINPALVVGMAGFAIFVNGVLIAQMPDDSYPTLNELVIAIVEAINSNDNGYTAIYDGSSLIIEQETPDETATTLTIQILKGDTVFAEYEETFTGAVNDTQEEQRVREDNNCLTVEEVEAMIEVGLEMCAKCCGDEERQIVSDWVL